MRPGVGIVVFGVVNGRANSFLAAAVRAESQDRPVPEARRPNGPELGHLRGELLQLCVAGCFFWGARG